MNLPSGRSERYKKQGSGTNVNIQETRLTAELTSSGELNKYLSEGWVLILSYVKHLSDSHQPRFVVAWQNDGPPIFPELLDEWEQREILRQVNR